MEALRVPLVYRSKYSQLMVSFPPERFGMGKNVEGKDAPYPNLHFQMGMYATKNEKLIELLRKHNGNEANNGEDFWEEDPVDTAAVQVAAGEVVVAKPNAEITEPIRECLKYLEYAAIKGAPQQANNICEKLQQVTDHFRIMGLPNTNPDMDIKRIRARITEYLGALDDVGIRGGDDGGRNIERSEVPDRD